MRVRTAREGARCDARTHGQVSAVRRPAPDARPGTCSSKGGERNRAKPLTRAISSSRSRSRLPWCRVVRVQRLIIHRGAFSPTASDQASTADGFLPNLDRLETNWFACVPYPLRGADSLGVIAITSVVFWAFTVLVPEYCLTLVGDAESMGAAALGHLIALISILPFVLLFPLLIFYWLQYLGRVLVSSAMGETRPPRSPDRNFDGFFSGMSPWLVWLRWGFRLGSCRLACMSSRRARGPTSTAWLLSSSCYLAFRTS